MPAFLPLIDLHARKLRRARRFARLFGLLPWVRLVCVCGSVAWGTADEESDIDFCIVTRAGRIWSTRFVIAGVLEVFGLRPRADKKSDQICTSFFVTVDALDLSPLALRNDAGQIDDPLFVKWIETMVPLVDRGKTFERFREANQWGNPPTSSPLSKGGETEKNFSPLVEGGDEEGGFLGNWFERLAKRYQLSHLNPLIADESVKPNTNVVLSDTVLKLHTNDRREEYRRNKKGPPPEDSMEVEE